MEQTSGYLTHNEALISSMLPCLQILLSILVTRCNRSANSCEQLILPSTMSSNTGGNIRADRAIQFNVIRHSGGIMSAYSFNLIRPCRRCTVIGATQTKAFSCPAAGGFLFKDRPRLELSKCISATSVFLPQMSLLLCLQNGSVANNGAMCSQIKSRNHAATSSWGFDSGQMSATVLPNRRAISSRMRMVGRSPLIT